MPEYVIDTSALIDAKEIFPPENFGSFWDRLHDMNIKSKLIITNKVKDELKKGNDFLSSTFLLNKKFTEDEDKETINYLQHIMNNLPKENFIGFQNWLKSADPFIIAFTLRISKLSGEKVILLHGEVERGKKLRIPYVCKHFNIEHGRMNKLIIEENIKFKVQ